MTGTFTFPRGAFVGFDQIFDDLERLTVSHKKDHYPPHNVVKFSEDEYLIELAVTGFKREDIQISLHEGILTIEGKRDQRRDQDLYVYKGISGRQFKRSFRLSEFVEVTGADLDAGLLVVHLKRVVPEEKRPRVITINKPGESTHDNTHTKAELLTEASAGVSS
jgi:molecular chaperone IbpA